MKPRTPLPWTPRIIVHLAIAEDVDYALAACNSHDALIAALEWALPWLEKMPLPRYDHGARQRFGNKLEIARQTLAQAKRAS